MNSLILRTIALITMIIDHTGAVFFPGVDSFRIIGRIAFPIYCFLLVEGFRHSSDVKRYIRRLAAFAIISELPFDLAFFGKLEITHQNIFFTLTLGLIAIYLMDTKGKELPYMGLVSIVVAMVLASLLNTDYGYIGILYILIFYHTRLMTGPMRHLIAFIVFTLSNFLLTGGLQLYSSLAFIFIIAYNGNPGPRSKAIQYFYYAAYPLHLMVIFLISIYVI